MLYALCGVSSVGKTTLLQAVLQRRHDLRRLVTFTTRPPRPGEVHEVDYHFLTSSSFQAAVEAGRIVCPILYRGYWYGTAWADLQACATNDMISVLRPDKLAALQSYMTTPILSIAIVRPGQVQVASVEDQEILALLPRCSYQLINQPGHLEEAITQLLSLLHTLREGSGI